MLGIPPTGKPVEIPMCVVYDVEAGIIQRGRWYYDGATMARQLGLMPPE
ncbi:MAG: ester cyclase [Anaerolineales bacterium]|nr:ester cyclase [Anaerolineales bacterium]